MQNFEITAKSYLNIYYSGPLNLHINIDSIKIYFLTIIKWVSGKKVLHFSEMEVIWSHRYVGQN